MFRISAAGKYSVWRQFDASNVIYLTLDNHNRIYGVTTNGGEPCNCGTVFTLSRKGDETILYTFTRVTLGLPHGPLTIDASGNLYGSGAGKPSGSIFTLGNNGVFKVIHRFKWPGDVFPQGDLVLDPAGLIYGTTSFGESEFGSIFQASETKDYQTLYSFGKSAVPEGGLIADESGNLFGEMNVLGTLRGEIYELAK